MTTMPRDRLRELLDAVLDEDNGSLADMAGDAFASPFHFGRLVTRGSGESPMAMRRRVMLERAAWQLRQGLPVTEAAFGDPAFEADYIQLKREILATSSKPMPLVNTEGQMETLVGTAIGQLFATIASGGTVTEDDVRAALADANAQIIAQA